MIPLTMDQAREAERAAAKYSRECTRAFVYWVDLMNWAEMV